MGPATSSIRKIHLDPLFPVHLLLGHSLLKLSHFPVSSHVECWASTSLYTEK